MALFIKLISSNGKAEALINTRASAFVLLSKGALRAKISHNHPDESLQLGESFIGDKEYCDNKEHIFRNDKKLLEKLGYASFRGTNRGTIMKILNSEIYELYFSPENEATETSKEASGETSQNQRKTIKIDVPRNERGSEQPQNHKNRDEQRSGQKASQEASKRTSQNQRKIVKASEPRNERGSGQRASQETTNKELKELKNINILAADEPAASSKKYKTLSGLARLRVESLALKFSQRQSTKSQLADWQIRAAQCAIDLGINLDAENEGVPIGGSWFNLFKRSQENKNGKAKNLEDAFQHLVDNKNRDTFNDLDKFKIFCKMYHHGRDAVLNNTSKKYNVV